LRFVPEETWGDSIARIFAFEPLESCDFQIPVVEEGMPFSSVRAGIDPSDLAPPENEGLACLTALRGA
jgi:hypothetical protein